MNAKELICNYQEHWGIKPPLYLPKPLSEEQIKLVQTLFETNYPNYVAWCKEVQKTLDMKGEIA